MEFIKLEFVGRKRSDVRVSLCKMNKTFYNRLFFSNEILNKINVIAGDRISILHSPDKKNIKIKKNNLSGGFKMYPILKAKCSVLNVKQFLDMEPGTKHIERFEVDVDDGSIVIYL